MRSSDAQCCLGIELRHECVHSSSAQCYLEMELDTSFCTAAVHKLRYEGRVKTIGEKAQEDCNNSNSNNNNNSSSDVGAVPANAVVDCYMYDVSVLLKGRNIVPTLAQLLRRHALQR